MRMGLIGRERKREIGKKRRKRVDGWIKPMIWNRGERVDRDKSKKKKEEEEEERYSFIEKQSGSVEGVARDRWIDEPS